ncbi:Pentatricopeptide repeat-containing protein mitochondrial [Zea mays]|uniref:Pentatricopeptide repeat-containing protein mitochondrial n=1 Tax=Zea mays TaxID=4577 RepID=A0A1D6NMD5_MAIZE|nr:Pentatricopeptide repeat-containing protein mitochondrial [Zea mays]
MAAATFSAAGRRLLSTAAAAAEKTELPVPIARLRQLARAGRLDDIDATLAPLFPSHPVAALSALSTLGLPDRASALLGTMTSPNTAHLNAVLGPLLRRRRLAGLVPSILAGKKADVVPDCATYSCVVGALCGAGRWSEAEDVFYAGVKRRKVADLGTVRVLVRGLKDAGKGRAARRVVVGLCKKFPEMFDGPWRELEVAAGLNSSGKEDGDVEDGADEKLAMTRATVA